jgi:hypothetical protein
MGHASTLEKRNVFILRIRHFDARGSPSCHRPRPSSRLHLIVEERSLIRAAQPVGRAQSAVSERMRQRGIDEAYVAVGGPRLP